MKNYLLFVVIAGLLLLNAGQVSGQAGAVYTVAGGGSSTADGVPATSAQLDNTTGLGIDGMGNLYVADRGNYVVRRIDAGSGLIHTVAGNGIAGFSGDGGPATDAQLNFNIRGIYVDNLGNIFISDESRIRKVNATTGIITTVMGGGSSSADGIPATDASLNPQCVYVDETGNIYSGNANRVKKVDATTGLISTFAGGGSSTADGIPATDASLSGSAKSLRMDNAGNLYIIDFGGQKVRKVDAGTGLMYTVAGGGSSILEGIPATSASFLDFHNCGVDGAGNIFIADWNRGLIRRVDASTGIINTIAGSSSGGSPAEGTPAMSASIRPYMILVDPSGGNLYYSDFSTKVKRLSFSPLVPYSGGGSISDTLAVYIHKQCGGPQLTLRTGIFHAGMMIINYFGDGSSDTSTVSPAYIGSGGYALASHNYPASGTYSVKHVLYDAGSAVDSLTHTYEHIFCSTIPVKFFGDGNINCVMDGAETFIKQNIVTEVDSNGVHIDTISATSGFNYQAFGNPGDVYRFRILSTPSSFYTSCPASGIVYDTLVAGLTSNSTSWMGLSCVSASTYDLAATAIVPVTGPNDQWGHIYVRNNYCIPTDATVTLYFSPKYRYTTGGRPAPVSSTATSMTWNLAALSSTDATPVDIYYVVWHNPAVPYPADGDTVREMIVVTPTTGDADETSNMIIRVDTVSTSCDPNAIEVNPPGCFDGDETLQFTVHFENVGSDTAVNIYVMDTLSGSLDPTTLKIITSSDPMFITKFVVDGKTILKCDFPNINLPDSSHHGDCDGMFRYTVKTKPGLPVGSSIFSRVGIYFDYNDVVMTNTVQNIKGCPETSVRTLGTTHNILLYPNPATDELTITADPGAFTSLTITNTMGQHVMQQTVAGAQTKVSVQALTAGVYYVTLRGAYGNEVRKFVKW